MVEHKTVGQICKELLEKPDTKQPVFDTSEEMAKQYIPNIESLVTTSECKDWTEPFYIEVRPKREKLLINAIKYHFIARKSRPLPDYDHDVWKYFPSTSNLKFLWSIPVKDAVDYLIANEPYLNNVERESLKYCKLFKSGQLDKVYGE